MTGNLFPISPHSTLAQKVLNFPDDVYNFNQGDNLTKLMTILLGNSGTGQLSNIQTVARLGQQNIEYSNLDNILGEIMQVKRASSEIYSFATNPFIDQLLDSQWQEIYSKDSSYRERLLGAAEAFQNGAVLWAIITLCEALSGLKFYAVESWRTPGYGRSSINSGQEVVLIPLTDGSFFTWDQSKAYYILDVINRIIPSNFIISFGSPTVTMTKVPLSNVTVSGSEPAGYSEYFHLQTTVTTSQMNTPGVLQAGAGTRYWIKNNTTNVAPYFAHLQTQEIIIDSTGNITNVVASDTNGSGPASNSVAIPTLQVTSTVYGAQ